MCKLYDPLCVANNFIEMGIFDREALSPMKLQKLLYFSYRDYLKLTNNPLFPDRFEAWKYGPVLSCVYEAFKGYGAKDIKDYYVNKEGKSVKVKEGSNDNFDKIIRGVWIKYRKHTGIDLSKITHQVNSAWYKAWVANEVFLSDEYIKSEEVA